jgi:hypothetical protein
MPSSATGQDPPTLRLVCTVCLVKLGGRSTGTVPEPPECSLP